MSTKSGFWNSVNDDRIYMADDVNNLFGQIFTEGVFKNVGQEFALTYTPSSEEVSRKKRKITQKRVSRSRTKLVSDVEVGTVAIASGLYFSGSNPSIWVYNDEPLELPVYYNPDHTKEYHSCYIAIRIARSNPEFSRTADFDTFVEPTSGNNQLSNTQYRVIGEIKFKTSDPAEYTLINYINNSDISNSVPYVKNKLVSNEVYDPSNDPTITNIITAIEGMQTDITGLNDFVNGNGYVRSEGLVTLADINNLSLKNGVYSFDLRQANESITTVDGTIITTGAIINFKHYNANLGYREDYPGQLLIPFADNRITGIWKRVANGTTWGGWFRTTDYSPITTQTELDSQIRSSGIYYCHLTQTFPGVGNRAYFMLIHNRFELGTSGYAQQIAVPFDSGVMSGVYYRVANGATWNPWKSVEDNGKVKYLAIGGVTSGSSYVPPKYPNEDITLDDLKNANFPYPYMTTILNGSDIGLTGSWYHILYFRHWDNNGYGAQIALSLNVNTKAYWRNSTGTTWNAWRQFYDSVNKPTAADIGALPLTGGTLTGQLKCPRVESTAMPNNTNPGWIMCGNTNSGLNYFINTDQLRSIINNRTNKVSEANTNYTTPMARATSILSYTPSTLVNGAIALVV